MKTIKNIQQKKNLLKLSAYINLNKNKRKRRYILKNKNNKL